MKISILGMGYVGIVSGACLLHMGHTILAVEPASEKLHVLKSGLSPIEEPRVSDLLAEGYLQGRFHAQANIDAAVLDSDMIWICVGTPSHSNGSIDLSALQAVAQELHALRHNSARYPLIVIRSTCLPGSIGSIFCQLIDANDTISVRPRLIYHPEFMREGAAVEDFFNPARIIVGEDQPGDADPLLALYSAYTCPTFRLRLDEAALIKYYDNTFHALKVTFANELGRIAKALALDSRRLSEVFCADAKLNISAKYLRPGPPFGGSCLPKDIRALQRLASVKSIAAPMLSSLLSSNHAQVEDIIHRILSRRPNVVGIVGIAFKHGTDDMRESPYVRIAKALLGEGIAVKIYDAAVIPERLLGANREQTINAIRSLAELLVAEPEDIMPADLVLLNHDVISNETVSRWIASGAHILDVAGSVQGSYGSDSYDGLYW